jgi:hypothetical protein
MLDWQAALDTKEQLLAAGDLVAANRVERARVGPRVEHQAPLRRAPPAGYSAAQGRSKAGTAAVVVATTLLSLVLLVAGRAGPGPAAVGRGQGPGTNGAA